MTDAAGSTEPGPELPSAVALLRSQAFLILGQVYLLWLMATSRSTFTQLMFMNCAELLLASLVATLIFSRTWKGFSRRIGELLVMTLFCAALLLAFGLVELPPGGPHSEFEDWLRMIQALISSDSLRYSLIYLGVTVGAWLVLAATSGNARHWWVMNVAFQTSAAFGAMLVIWGVALVMVMVTGGLVDHFKPPTRTTAIVHVVETVVLMIAFCVTRVWFSWTMHAKLSPEDVRKVEQKYFFDSP